MCIRDRAYWALYAVTHPPSHPDSRYTAVLNCFIFAAAILFPLLGGWALRRTKLNPHNRYLAALVACVVVLIVCMIAGSIVDPGAWVFGCLFPPDAVPMLLMLENNTFPHQVDYEAAGQVLAAFSSAVTICVALLPSIRHWKTFDVLERRAAQMNQESKAAAPVATTPPQPELPPVLPS